MYVYIREMETITTVKMNISLCVLSRFSHIQLFATSWTIACQAPLSMGLPWQEYWSGLPCPPLGDLPNPAIKPSSPALQADSSPAEPLGKPMNLSVTQKCFLVPFSDLFLHLSFPSLTSCLVWSAFCHYKF